VYGEGRFSITFGGLSIEMAALKALGSLLTGSGRVEAVATLSSLAGWVQLEGHHTVSLKGEKWVREVSCNRIFTHLEVPLRETGRFRLASAALVEAVNGAGLIEAGSTQGLLSASHLRRCRRGVHRQRPRF
jgi:hypothetical protein